MHNRYVLGTKVMIQWKGARTKASHLKLNTNSFLKQLRVVRPMQALRTLHTNIPQIQVPYVGQT